VEEHVGRQFVKERLIQRGQGVRRGRLLRAYPADQDPVPLVATSHRHLAIELRPDVAPDGAQMLVDVGQDAGDARGLRLGLVMATGLVMKTGRPGGELLARDRSPRDRFPRLPGAPAEIAQRQPKLLNLLAALPRLLLKARA